MAVPVPTPVPVSMSVSVSQSSSSSVVVAIRVPPFPPVATVEELLKPVTIPVVAPESGVVATTGPVATLVLSVLVVTTKPVLDVVVGTSVSVSQSSSSSDEMIALLLFVPVAEPVLLEAEPVDTVPEPEPVPLDTGLEPPVVIPVVPVVLAVVVPGVVKIGVVKIGVVKIGVVVGVVDVVGSSVSIQSSSSSDDEAIELEDETVEEILLVEIAVGVVELVFDVTTLEVVVGVLKDEDVLGVVRVELEVELVVGDVAGVVLEVVVPVDPEELSKAAWITKLAPPSAVAPPRGPSIPALAVLDAAIKVVAVGFTVKGEVAAAAATAAGDEVVVSSPNPRNLFKCAFL